MLVVNTWVTTPVALPLENEMAALLFLKRLFQAQFITHRSTPARLRNPEHLPMDSVKCTNCGLVSWADSTSCKRCGESLLHQSTPINAKSSNAATFISGALLALVLGGLALGLYIGAVGYSLMALALLTSLGYSIWRVYRSTQQLDSTGLALTALVLNTVLLLVLGVAVPVVLLREHALGTPPKWREHVSVKGGYSLQLPGDPHENQRQFPSQTGPMTMYSVTAYLGQNGEYTSSYLELPQGRLTVSDDEFLEFMYRQTISQEKGVVLDKKPLAFDSANGLAVKALEAQILLDEQTHGRSAIAIVRLYWVKERNTVYMNVATFVHSANHNATAAKFLDSFRLVT